MCKQLLLFVFVLFIFVNPYTAPQIQKDVTAYL